MTGRPLRASDQDRDEAVLALSDHYAEGRLDHDEFESRMTAASQATYLHDLDPLFADLPTRARSTRAVEGGPPLPAGRPRPRVPVAPLLLLVVVTAVVVTQGHAIWLLLLAWWVGLTMTRRRGWQRHRWAVAEIPPHHRPHGAHDRPGRGGDD